ncbi:MAG: hypothetical protein GC149_19275 [Gammaproteobacteria bacterium]|nr:hypothetical protein [Gammaproteobacteria bacterium]
MSKHFDSSDIITDNCTLVRGPDNKLRLLLPVTPEVVAGVNASSLPGRQTEPASKPTEQSVPAPLIGESSANISEDSVRKLVEGREWIVTKRCISHFCSTYRITHRLDRRTYVELWDHHDGLGTVRRSVKPRRGQSVKDRPMSDQPIVACLERVQEWIGRNPLTWTKCNEPGSASARARRRKRMKLFNSLFPGR